MTREEEIQKAAVECAEKIDKKYAYKNTELPYVVAIEAFKEGAEWADKHPASPEAAGAQAIDWEQRRYEIARDILPQIVQMSASYKEEHVGNNTTKKQTTIEGPRVAMLAVGLADCLVEELKKTDHHGEH